MKNVLSLLTVVGLAASIFAPAAHADQFVARYTYLVNGAPATTLAQPALLENSCGTVLSQPAIVGDSCGTQVLSAPAVVGGAAPVMVEDHENLIPHFFHIGLWPLVDFSIF